MGPSGASTAEAVLAAQKQPSTMPTAAHPGDHAHEAAPSAGSNSMTSVHVKLPPIIDFSCDMSPDEIDQRFLKLCEKHPPSMDYNRYLDKLTLQLHCPLPLLMPSPFPSHPATPLPYPITAYTVHAPVRLAKPAPPAQQEAVSTSSSLRYRLMGKSSSDPRFHYTPPSRPVSRVHSAAVMRSTPEPQPRSTAARAAVAEAPAPGGSSRMQVVQKVCAVCRRLHDVQRTATKARYCIQCEKLRWQLRAYGGKVQHLRDAYQQVGEPDDTLAILEAAKRLALLDAGAPMSPPAPAAAQPPAQSSAARSDSRPPSTAPSSAGVTDGDTEADMDVDAAAQTAPPEAFGPGAAGAAADVSGAAAAPAGAEEDLDELAALLAGEPVGGGQEGEAGRDGGDPMQRRATMEQRPCDLCSRSFVTPIHSHAMLCEDCEVLKVSAKKAGYTYTELQQGVGSGHIQPHLKPSVTDIRRLLGDMFLGKAIKLPRERKDRSQPASTTPPPAGPVV